MAQFPALLDGSPLLEDLVLERCDFADNLIRISSSSASGLPLKRLTIVYCTSSSSNDMCHMDLEIEAPNLKILNLYGFGIYGQSLLKNVLSLREVYLEIWPEDDVSVESLTVLESWLKGNYHVNVLKLSCFCIEVYGFELFPLSE